EDTLLRNNPGEEDTPPPSPSTQEVPDLKAFRKTISTAPPPSNTEAGGDTPPRDTGQRAAQRPSSIRNPLRNPSRNPLQSAQNLAADARRLAEIAQKLSWFAPP